MIPEFLWWLHSSKKEGLIPRIHSFEGSLTSNSATPGTTLYTHDDDEFDFLVMLCVAQGYDAGFATTYVRRLKIQVVLAATQIPIGVATTPTASTNHVASINVPSPFLIRDGDALHLAAWFTASAATNRIVGSGYGFLIPRLEI